MTLNEVLENLRKTAEEFTTEAADTRRPTWAPALVVSDEFISLARALGLLPQGEKEIARLWARFADPRRKGTLLRQEFGLTLPDVRCRGFDLHVGTRRRGGRLFYAQRRDDGSWHTAASSSWTGGPWEDGQALNERVSFRNYISFLRSVIEDRGGPEQQPNVVADLERTQAEYDQMVSKSEGITAERKANILRHERLLELARARVIEFGGGGDAGMMAQMAAGARVTGNCCICGAVLTDPVSVEYGIGPICRTKHSSAIAEWVARHAADIDKKDNDLFARVS